MAKKSFKKKDKEEAWVGQLMVILDLDVGNINLNKCNSINLYTVKNNP